MDARHRKRLVILHRLASCLLLGAAVLLLTRGAAADDEERTLSLADGKLKLKAPREWLKKPPANRIIDYEFQAPVVKEDKIPARITIMGAGGSVEANVQRWMGQFTQPDGKSTKDRTVIEKLKVSGLDVRLVTIDGTFRDKPGGPFSRRPAVQREKFRMLGAIIITEKLGQYFVKMYGPKDTVAANEKALKELIDSVKLE